ncbi:hypothetical protein GCM10011495_39950 [Hymenobacter frigidus]|uniref:Uncharacterized protein n=1 Tax=Hymenobacter frigidus TaxID=1524095 RepID=A0ABQ2AJT1_9BACT|nr:hypothetical protein GCM10011495_39950 [Hymenobacter frigidus]
MVQLGGHGVGRGQGAFGPLGKKQGQQAIGKGAESGSGQGIRGYGVGLGQLFDKRE